MNQKEFYIFVLILLVGNFLLGLQLWTAIFASPTYFFTRPSFKMNSAIIHIKCNIAQQGFLLFLSLNFMLFAPCLIEHPLRLRNLVCLNCDRQYEGKLSYHTICRTNKLTKRLILYLNERPRKSWQIPSIALRFWDGASCIW